MIKKAWNNPNIANLTLGDTKTDQMDSRAVINGTCTACGKTDISVFDSWKHAFVSIPGYTGYLCKKDMPTS